MKEIEYILIGLHTESFCVSLQKLFSDYNIDFKIEKWKPEKSLSDSGLFAIYIAENHLKSAIDISEKIERQKNYEFLKGEKGNLSNILLLPVDFSESSIKSCKVGFDIAQRLSLTPLLIHAYDTEVSVKTFNFSIKDNPFLSLDLDFRKQESKEMREISRRLMDGFSSMLMQLQSVGKLPDIKFQSEIMQGVADDVIKDCVKQASPEIVVMSTHDAKSRHEQLVGSIAAEVIDSCRVPVFTVPENSEITKIEDVKTLMCLCNYDGDDLKAIDNLMKFFDYPEVKIILVPSSLKQVNRSMQKLSSLAKILKATYPLSEFVVAQHSDYKKMGDLIDASIKDYNVQVFIVPNKRQRGLQRIYNPGVAHKLLFEENIPLFAIPV